jgi:hypothetical protein
LALRGGLAQPRASRHLEEQRVVERTESQEIEKAPPTSSELAKRLGKAYTAFEALTARHAEATSEWRRRGTLPFVLKVSQGDRTLYYVQPARGSFDVTVVLGARATEAALSGRVRKGLHAAILGARAYAEGRPVRVTVKSEADVDGVEELLAVKLDPDGRKRERISRG